MLFASRIVMSGIRGKGEQDISSVQGWRLGRAGGAILPPSEHGSPRWKVKSDFSEIFGIHSTLKAIF